MKNPADYVEEHNATARLRYSLHRLYYISGGYVYNQVDADINIDDFVDHRFS